MKLLSLIALVVVLTTSCDEVRKHKEAVQCSYQMQGGEIQYVNCHHLFTWEGCLYAKMCDGEEVDLGCGTFRIISNR